MQNIEVMALVLNSLEAFGGSQRMDKKAVAYRDEELRRRGQTGRYLCVGWGEVLV